MGKVIFFDIDGTLVDFKGRMPESAKLALRQVQENGHRIVICSGRAKCQIYPWLLEIGFDGIVGGTGSYVENRGELIYQHFIPKEYLKEAVEALKQANAFYSVQVQNGMAASEKSAKGLSEKFQLLGVGREALDQIWSNTEIDEHIELREDVQKFIYHDSRWDVDRLAGELGEHYDVTPSSFEKEVYDAGELTLKGINKAFGMQKYIEAAGISKEDTIAVGDGPNDFDMLDFARIGVAMGNAREALKEHADYVTTNVNEDGIANALKHLGLIA